MPPRRRSKRKGRVTYLTGIAAVACAAVPARAPAQDMADLNAQIGKLQVELAAQRKQMEEQTRRIAQQQEELDRLLKRVVGADHGAIASTSLQPAPVTPPASSERPAVAEASGSALPDVPVGGSPGLTRVEQASAVLQGAGVLTLRGRFVLEPSVEYTSSSSNSLVFRGVELIPGIQVGLIDASNVDRDTIVLAQTVRYGLTRNLELEARVPFLWRSDRSAATQQQQGTISEATRLSQNGLGDIEIGLRYQLNHPVGEKPILIGTFRVKSDTGRSPFAVPFDSSGVAQGLATGSGFWAIQPGFSFLLPSDPVVIFGGVSYLRQFSKDIDRQIGTAMIGRVDPGDAAAANIGFGFALNPRFSFSLGYQHNYIFPMHWLIDGASNRSDGLQVGAFTLGMSYRLTERKTVNFALELGATHDAPDVSLIIRLPISPE